MKVVYDPETDTLDLILNEQKVVESDEPRSDIVIDYDADGNIVSIEILNASKHVASPQSLLYELKKKKETA